MKSKLVRYSLILGLGIFLLSVFGKIIEEPSLLLIFVVFGPGLLYGLLLVTVDNNSKSINQFGLWTGCTVIYVLCFYLATDSKGKIDAFSRTVLASMLGALLLSTMYAMFVNKVLSFKRCVLWPLIIGAVSAMPSAISMYFMDKNEIVMSIGVVTIFPIWQTLTSFNIARMSDKIRDGLE